MFFYQKCVFSHVDIYIINVFNKAKIEFLGNFDEFSRFLYFG